MSLRAVARVFPRGWWSSSPRFPAPAQSAHRRQGQRQRHPVADRGIAALSPPMYPHIVAALDRLVKKVSTTLTRLENPHCSCDSAITREWWQPHSSPDCWFSRTHTQRAETRAREALSAALSDRDALQAIIEAKGASETYKAVRALLENTLCENCGCPVDEGKTHYPGGMGYCYMGSDDG